MKKTGIILVIVVAVVAIIGFWAVSSYNNFVTLDQDVQQNWSQVEVQYQRRMDLIPNLVSTVQGYAEHESSTFENVTRARAGLENAYNAAAADSAATPADAAAFQRLNANQGELNRALSIYVNAVREAYPDLKANTQFLDLQAQLEGTENRIATARTRYNEVVRDYNVRIRRFPANLMAGIFGFDVKPQYEADAEAATAPRVQF